MSLVVGLNGKTIIKLLNSPKALPSYPEKAQCVWRPNPNLDKEKCIKLKVQFRVANFSPFSK